MRKILCCLLVVLATSVLLSVVSFYTRTPGVNDCVITYARLLRHNGQTPLTTSPTGTTYKFDTGETHIEYGRQDSLAEFETSTVRGCFRNTGNYFADYVNTVYCTTSYFLVK